MTPPTPSELVELAELLFVKHPKPWTATEECDPIGDTGDADYPWVVRDANGKEVATFFEKYASGKLEPLHQMLAVMLVRASQENSRG